MTLQDTQPTPDITSQDLAYAIADAADDRKGGDILLLDVREVSYLTDYFVIVTGFSKAQVRAIADTIEEKISKTYGQVPAHTEGYQEAVWVLQDYSDVIVHVFLPQEREFYNLEAFWGQGTTIPFVPPTP